MKVYVFVFNMDLCSYGDGLVFVGEKSERVEFYKKVTCSKGRKEYKLLGLFELPDDFLKKIGLKDEYDSADYCYVE